MGAALSRRRRDHRRVQARAEHAGVGDGDRRDLAEPERVGVLLRTGGGVADGTGLDLLRQLIPPFRREGPLDVRDAEPLGVRDVLPHPARQCGEVAELHLDADAGVVDERKLRAILIPGSVRPGAQLLGRPPGDRALIPFFSRVTEVFTASRSRATWSYTGSIAGPS